MTSGSIEATALLRILPFVAKEDPRPVAWELVNNSALQPLPSDTESAE